MCSPCSNPTCELIRLQTPAINPYAAHTPQVAKQRDALLREQTKLGDLNNEVEAVRATLAKTAAELAQKSASNEAARTGLDDKRGRLDAARKKYAVLRRKLESEFQALDSLEGRVEEMEALRKVRLGGLFHSLVVVFVSCRCVVHVFGSGWLRLGQLGGIAFDPC